jgi:hypothetical protein
MLLSTLEYQRVGVALYYKNSIISIIYTVNVSKLVMLESCRYTMHSQLLRVGRSCM